MKGKRIAKIMLAAACVAAMGAGSVAAFTGCANDVETVTVSGSTSMTELMQALAAEYEDTHSNVRIIVNQGGSSVGISDTKAGLNDFGLASKKVEEGDGVKGVQLCLDGIALTVNKNCEVTQVANEEVFDLYMKGVAIQNTVTTAIARDQASGTREAFNKGIKDENGKDIKNEYGGKYELSGYTHAAWDEQQATGSVISLIEKSNVSIGYISLGSVLMSSANIKALAFKGYGQTEYVAATAENVLNGTYALQRPFTIVLSTTRELSPAAQGFYDYIMSEEAQAVITAEGCVSTYGK